MPWELSGNKIAGRHRSRLAVVDVRQSTRQQVVGHQESTRLQYALVDRAVALGWDAGRVVVIDNDLGMSGRRRARGSGSSGWSHRSGWITSVWCSGSRCLSWPGRARIGISSLSFVRYPGRCSLMSTGSTTRSSTTTGCCSA